MQANVPYEATGAAIASPRASGWAARNGLDEMNIQIHRVFSDITGYTGMAIIRAILAGERVRLSLPK